MSAMFIKQPTKKTPKAPSAPVAAPVAAQPRGATQFETPEMDPNLKAVAILKARK